MPLRFTKVTTLFIFSFYFLSVFIFDIKISKAFCNKFDDFSNFSCEPKGAGWCAGPVVGAGLCGSGQSLFSSLSETNISCNYGSAGVYYDLEQWCCSDGDDPGFTCGSSTPVCNTADNTPVWVRVVEKGGPTGTIAWKPSSYNMLNGIKWSLATNRFEDMFDYDDTLNATTGQFIRYTAAFPEEGMGAATYRTDYAKTWDVSRNKLSPDLYLGLQNVYKGPVWSNHFCTGSRAGALNPSANNFPWDTTNNRPWLDVKWNNGLIVDYGDDVDGCWVGGNEFYRMSNMSGERMGVLREFLTYIGYTTGDSGWRWVDKKYDEYWTMSFDSLDTATCGVDDQDLQIDFTPPYGYKCSNIGYWGKFGGDCPTTGNICYRSGGGHAVNLRYIPEMGICSITGDLKDKGNFVLFEIEPLAAPPIGKITAPATSSSPNVLPDAKVCSGDNISFSYSANHSENIYAAHLYSKEVTGTSWRTHLNTTDINLKNYSTTTPISTNTKNFIKNKDYYFTVNFETRLNLLNSYSRCSGNPEVNYSGNKDYSYCGNNSFASNPKIDNSVDRPWRKIHVVADADTPVITDISPTNLATRLKIEYTTTNTDTLGLVLYRKLATAPDSDYYVIDSFESGIIYSSFLKYYSSGTQTSSDGNAKYTCTGTVPNVNCVVEYTDTTCNGTLFSYKAKLVVGYPTANNTYYSCPYSVFSNVLTNVSCTVPNQVPIFTIAGFRFSLSGPLIPLTPGYLVSPYLGAVLHYTITDAENDASIFSPSVNFGNLYDNNNPPALPPAQSVIQALPPTTLKYRWIPSISFSSTVGDVGWKVNGVNLTADPNANFVLTATGTAVNTPLGSNNTLVRATYSANIKLREPTGAIQFQPVKEIGANIVSADYSPNCTNTATFDSLSTISDDSYKKPNISFTYNSYTPSQVSNLSLTSALSQKNITALPDANTKYTATITLPSNSTNQYEVKCVYVYMATSDPSAGTLVYSGSRVNSFSIPMEYNRTYSLKVVVGKSNSANSWIQGVGSSLNAKNYSANYENFPSGEFLLKDGVNTKAGVFFTKYNITGTNFSAPSSFASNKKFLAINNTNALSITDISSRGYLSKSNFFEDYKLNYANCTSSNNVSGAINSDECFTPSSGDTITVTGALTPGPNSRNFYFDAPVVKISSNIKKPGASQNKSLPLFVVKNDLIIDSTVTSLEGIFLVGGSVVFNTEGTNQNDARIVIEGSIIAKKDIIVYRDGLYNLDAQNNTLPIVRVDYLPRFLLDANFNYLREYSVSIFNND